MRQKRNRTLRRKEDRELTKRLSKARREAGDQRRAQGLCEHGDEERIYFSQEEIDADKTPNVICGDCGRPKLRVPILRDGPPRPLPEFGEFFIKDILRREE